MKLEKLKLLRIEATKLYNCSDKLQTKVTFNV